LFFVSPEEDRLTEHLSAKSPDALRGSGRAPSGGRFGTHDSGSRQLPDMTAIDRLGRSVAEVTRTIAALGQRRILLRALREGIDTATPHRPGGRGDHGHLGRAGTGTRPGTPRRRPRFTAIQLPVTKPPKLSAERQDQLHRLAAATASEPVKELPPPSASVAPPLTATSHRHLNRGSNHTTTQRFRIELSRPEGWRPFGIMSLAQIDPCRLGVVA